MKKLLTIALAIALVAVSALALAESTKLVVGATLVPHAEILEAAKPLLAEKGIDLEIVEFSDYVQPNLQLEAGDLDANYFQHIPYLNDFNAQNNTHLAILVEVHLEPMGIYVNPAKDISLDAIPSGAVVVVPNDTTNEARALALLQAQGVITLADGAGETATKIDIDENPFNVEVIEVEAVQVSRQLADADLAVINSNYALEAGEDIVGTPVALESTENNPYNNVVAIREGEDREELKVLAEVLAGEEIASFIAETYGTAVIPVK